MPTTLVPRGLVVASVATLLSLFAACGPEGLLGEVGQSLHDSFGLAFEPPSPVPNGTPATATRIIGTQEVVHGNLWPNGDIDFYSFDATAGDRVYLASNTQFSAGNSTDGQLTLYAGDGATVIEFDDDNGTYAALSPSIAGATLPTTGTYYIKVSDFTAGTTSERGYDLYFRLQSGAPTAEAEPNDTPATATPLPANGWVSGVRNPAAAVEQDWYAMQLNAGDTVFLSLDVNPERDGTVWNGRLGIALFGDAANQIIVVDDAGTGDVSPVPNNPSEALFLTVKDAGTYYAFVDSANAAVGDPTCTYHLNVTVFPRVPKGINCTTYTSTDVPLTIGPGNGLVSSTITIPGNPRIADINVGITLNHALMQDVDAHLRSPAGNDNGLFTDIGAAATGGQQQLDIVFDDEAALSPQATTLRALRSRPENNSSAGTASTSGAYRLRWFEGENAGGTWTLDLRDDTTGANGGTLTGWFIEICEPVPNEACTTGTAVELIPGGDFEAGAAGFTHSGTADEWELGLPATVATTTANPVAAFNTCASGTSCWKTDLDGTYDVSSNQDLYSPDIDLSTVAPPYYVSWSMRHQVETANFDHFYVDLEVVGGGTGQRLYEWLDPTPISASAGTGNPQNNIGGSAGWGVHTVRIDDALVGATVRLRFHLDTDANVVFGGVAIDDVRMSGCPLCGNGTLDAGEACDNGAANGTAGSCCNATCAFVPADTLCRADAAMCDAPEACTGASGVCPADVGVADGKPCDADGNLCTANDSCVAGACVAGAAVACPAADDCKLEGVCDPSTGACQETLKADASPCNDGNACTQTDACQAGVCTGTNPKVCTATDQCHDAGTCDAASGACSNPAKADGSTCNDGDDCTTTDVCQAGACSGSGSCNPGPGGGDGDSDGDSDGTGSPPDGSGTNDKDDGGCNGGGKPELGSLALVLVWLARRGRAKLRA